MQCLKIKHMIEDDCDINGITLPNVTSRILSKVSEYCKSHIDAPPPELKLRPPTVPSPQDRAAAAAGDEQDADHTTSSRNHVDAAAKPADASSSTAAPAPANRSAVATTEDELKKSDAELVKIDQATLYQLYMVLLEDEMQGCDLNRISLPSVTRRILSHLVEYGKNHVDHAPPKPTST